MTRTGNKATYSGKKKTHTLNTNITISPDGTVINISKTVPGSTNDLTLLRESPPDFGALSKAAADPETPEEERPVSIYDRGYQGIQKDNPGAETWLGMKAQRRIRPGYRQADPAGPRPQHRGHPLQDSPSSTP